jgi:Dolichyl-phosphate-mannose-protein mannosyltransferase
MRATKSSKPRRTSKSGAPASFGLLPLVVTAIFAALVGAAAVWFFYRDGSMMNFGDAEAHLDIARRVLDSRTPGYDQLGTVWLPLPHLLMIPFARDMRLWKTGLAGSIPSAACLVLATLFLFAAVRRMFGNTSCAVLAAGLFVLNPNVLFLQSTAMTESVFFACLFGLLYFCVLFQEKQSLVAVFGAGLMATLGSMTRYEGWFLLPFAALFFLLAGGDRRRWTMALFCCVAAIGPLFWLAYNRWFYMNPLEFFNGPYSPGAIQGGKAYPGHGDWLLAIRYYRAAVELCLGTPLFWISLAGVAACLIQFKRAAWPAVLLMLPPIFYVLNVHSGASPIHIPQLPPNSWYNTRYGLAVLPLGALGAAAIAGLMPNGLRPIVALALLLAGAGQWLLFPRPASWITWREAQVNSQARLEWTSETADYLAANYKKGESIFTSFGDMTGVYRRLGIPLRFTVTGDNGPEFDAAIARPDLFLFTTWVVTFTGDPQQSAVDKARLRGPKYDLVKEIMVKGGPVVQIYHREFDPHWKPK